MAPAETLGVELDGGGAGGVRVVWDAEALAALADGPAGARSPWRVEGEHAGELRVISAAFEDGTLLAVAALRSQGAEGHDADRVAGVLARPEAEPNAASEVRLSTEYDAAGRPRRTGVELFTESDVPPLRAAGDRREEPESSPGGEREPVAMEFRSEGRRGFGLYELSRS